MTSDLALVVREDDPLPPYEQLRRQLDTAIRAGVLAPGSRLPPLRQLAGDLGLAVGTVARTYRELEQAGLVTSRRAAGTRVADRLPEVPVEQRETALAEHAGAFVRAARALGIEGEGIVAAVRRALAEA